MSNSVLAAQLRSPEGGGTRHMIITSSASSALHNSCSSVSGWISGFCKAITSCCMLKSRPIVCCHVSVSGMSDSYSKRYFFVPVLKRMQRAKWRHQSQPSAIPTLFSSQQHAGELLSLTPSLNSVVCTLPSCVRKLLPGLVACTWILHFSTSAAFRPEVCRRRTLRESPYQR